MLKKVLLSVVVVLFVSSGAFAVIIPPMSPLLGSISHQQQFLVGDPLFTTNAGMSSVANLYHGASTAQVGQALQIFNEHTAFSGNDPSCLTQGTQEQYGDIQQAVEACGHCSVMTVSAFLDAFGSQDQFVGSSVDPKAQEQSLGLIGQQALLESDGAGGGTAVNDATLTQNQFGGNALGNVTEQSTIDLDQRSLVQGDAGSNPSTLSSAVVTTAQSQTVF
jgi:hypothetical protein